MPLFFKVIQEGRTDIIQRRHGVLSRRVQDPFEIAPQMQSVHNKKRASAWPALFLNSQLISAFKHIALAVQPFAFGFFWRHLKIKAVRRADLVFDLKCRTLIFFQEGFGVLTPLADTLIPI